MFFAAYPRNIYNHDTSSEKMTAEGSDHILYPNFEEHETFTANEPACCAMDKSPTHIVTFLILMLLLNIFLIIKLCFMKYSNTDFDSVNSSATLRYILCFMYGYNMYTENLYIFTNAFRAYAVFTCFSCFYFF